MNQSVRSALIGLWFLLFAICFGLGFFLVELYQRSGDNQLKQEEAVVERASQSIQNRYANYLANVGGDGGPGNRAAEIRELNLLLSLVLAQFDGVEGGFWTPNEGFVAYAFPTYGGADVKKDLPQTELKTISQVCRDALQSTKPRLNYFTREHRALVVQATPVRALGGNAVLWTMGWATVKDSDLFGSVIGILSCLFFCSLLSGIWLFAFLYQWSKRVTQLEQAVCHVAIEQLSVLPMTGQVELDRVVSALNQVNKQLKESQAASAQLSRELARADKLSALGRMVAGFAHEIRNPLATICLSAENALEGATGKQERLLKAILNEGQELEGLLQKLLAVAKLSELKPQEIQLKSWLEERLNSQRLRADALGLSLSGEAPERIWFFDEESIGRAFNNLLLNAMQNTPSGGWVVADVKVQTDKCVFGVEDSGPGVPLDQREMIFEPLVSGRPNGIGIGLTIVREVTEAHGGRVRCIQGAVGARFEMEIPWQKS
ncbi:MAG: HAMP domain-containing sensor histidine kinase [Candidatus Obscuribacterales bacterium]|nr:HAMP domain-containing sensor histidine kinase [Candidatus Obscuribacterales bacterium]